MAERYTKRDIENRCNSVNATLERHKSPYRVYAGASNGYTSLYETKAQDSSYHRHIIGGTKGDIATYLSAMMTGIFMVKDN